MTSSLVAQCRPSGAKVTAQPLSVFISSIPFIRPSLTSQSLAGWVPVLTGRVANVWPSGENARRTSPPSKWIGAIRSRPVATSQILTNWSAEAVATVLPSGETAS